MTGDLHDSVPFHTPGKKEKKAKRTLRVQLSFTYKSVSPKHPNPAQSHAPTTASLSKKRWSLTAMRDLDLLTVSNSERKGVKGHEDMQSLSLRKQSTFGDATTGFPAKYEKEAQKFHTDDALLPRSG